MEKLPLLNDFCSSPLYYILGGKKNQRSPYAWLSMDLSVCVVLFFPGLMEFLPVSWFAD